MVSQVPTCTTSPEQVAVGCRLGVEASKVTTADRDRTKHVVYAVVYGVGKCRASCTHVPVMVCICTGKERLAEMINVSPAVAKELTSSFLGLLHTSNVCS